MIHTSWIHFSIEHHIHKCKSIHHSKGMLHIPYWITKGRDDSLFIDRDLYHGRIFNIQSLKFSEPLVVCATLYALCMQHISFYSKWRSHSFPVWSIDAADYERPCPISQLDNLGWLWSVLVPVLMPCMLLYDWCVNDDGMLMMDVCWWWWMYYLHYMHH